MDGRAGIVQPLELPPGHAVMSVMGIAREGANLFRVTVADDTVLVLDSEQLKTLPQGEAKLASLLARERVVSTSSGKRKSQGEVREEKRCKGTSSVSEHAEGGEHDGGEEQERGAAEHAQTGVADAERAQEPGPSDAADCSDTSSARARVAEPGADDERLDAGSGPASKKQRTLTHMFGKTKRTDSFQEAGAAVHAEHREGGQQELPASGREVAEAALTTAAADLFSGSCAEDLAAVEWLRTHSEQPRCEDLLQQIMAWSGIAGKPNLRALAKAQGITLDNKQRSANALLIEERVRRHFRAAIAQERGRISCFPVRVVSGAAEHLPAAASSEDLPLCIEDVVDLRTLSQFRRQRADMPAHLRDAIMRITGGTLLNARNAAEIAKTLHARLRRCIQYPGAVKARQSKRQIDIPMTIAMKLHQREPPWK